MWKNNTDIWIMDNSTDAILRHARGKWVLRLHKYIISGAA